MKIQEKLFHVQQNLKAPKGQYNDFGNYKYRSCEDIQEAVKPILKEVKAVLTVHDEIILIGDRYYIKATAVLQDVESEESISNTAYARETDKRPKMDDAQLTGSCSSYARKYALNGLFCIDDSRDPDSMKPKEPDPVPATQNNKASEKITRQQAQDIQREMARTGTLVASVCGRYKVRMIHDLNQEQYKRAMSAFRKMDSVPAAAPAEQMEMDLGQYDDDMPFR